jgi:iron(II)-dependent oxidoreductase
VKSQRSEALPTHNALFQWAATTQEENMHYFGELMDRACDSDLMQNNYLLFFLSQHYAQHIETTNYILTQGHLQAESEFTVTSPLQSACLRGDFAEMKRGTYSVGAVDRLRHYDNECAEMFVELDSFEIAQRPVSNAEYLGFMEAGAYENAAYWSEDAWLWRSKHSISRPQHWRIDESENFYGTNANGPYTLEADSPVSGLSYHEASAFATWSKTRLPHEYEWEVAKKAHLLVCCGQVWEWCENTLHPYAGFKAYPYEGYSQPWFDQKHFTLRGHSAYTLPVVQRSTFRNFYQADKRHFPAGVRLLVR